MSEQALIIIVIQQWIEDAVLGLENLFCLPRTEADRPQTGFPNIKSAGLFLFHGAVLDEPFEHPVGKVELLKDQIETDAVHCDFEGTHMAASEVEWAHSLVLSNVRM